MTAWTLIYEALKKTNGNTDGDALIAAMKGIAWESPRGPISIDPETRDIVQTIYLRRVESVNGKPQVVEFDKLDKVKDPVKAKLKADGKLTAGRHCRSKQRSPTTVATTIAINVIARLVSLLFDGFAYGMLLFVLSVGLSVTLGMMNFVNLAHGSFAMVGGYVTVTLMRTAGWPFFATLPVAFLAAAAFSVVLERVLYRRLYRATELDQSLLTIGIVFVSIAVAAYMFGTTQQPVNLPAYIARPHRLWRFQLRRLSAFPDRRQRC